MTPDNPGIDTEHAEQIPIGNTDSPRNLFNNPLLHSIILVVLTLAAYANTFHVPLLFDDEGAIINNPVIRNLDNYFSNVSGYAEYPNRCIGYLSFAINYHFGGLNVVSYHVVNLGVHLLTGLLVYNLVRLTFRTPFLLESKLSSSRNMLALAIALIFALHPIQTQAVTYIYQRLASMSTMFYLAALVMHIQWRFNHREGARFLSARVLPLWILSLASAVLAMKIKETAFTLPYIILLYEFLFFGRPDRRLTAIMAPILLSNMLIPLTLINLDMGGSQFLNELSTSATTKMPLSRWEYLCTQFSVIITYIRLMIIPINQNLDYDYPLSISIFEPRALFSFIALLVVFVSAIYLWRRSGRKGQENLRLVSFGILWFFITLSIESSIIPIADVIFEHRLYLPSFGFILAVVILAVIVADLPEIQNLKLKRIAIPALAGVVLLMAGATYARNHVWRDWLTIWHDTVRKSPSKARPHNILGIGYLYRQLYDSAEQEFQKAIKLDPAYMEAYFNMGLVYRNMERYAESIEMYQKALGMSGGSKTLMAKIFSEIGANYVFLGNMDKAIDYFANAVKNEPEFTEFRNNYAHALMENGARDAAAAEFRTVLSMEPGNPRALQMLQEMGALRR